MATKTDDGSMAQAGDSAFGMAYAQAGKGVEEDPGRQTSWSASWHDNAHGRKKAIGQTGKPQQNGNGKSDTAKPRGGQKGHKGATYRPAPTRFERLSPVRHVTHDITEIPPPHDHQHVLEQAATSAVLGESSRRRRLRMWTRTAARTSLNPHRRPGRRRRFQLIPRELFAAHATDERKEPAAAPGMSHGTVHSVHDRHEWTPARQILDSYGRGCMWRDIAVPQKHFDPDVPAQQGRQCRGNPRMGWNDRVRRVERQENRVCWAFARDQASRPQESRLPGGARRAGRPVPRAPVRAPGERIHEETRLCPRKPRSWPNMQTLSTTKLNAYEDLFPCIPSTCNAR